MYQMNRINESPLVDPEKIAEDEHLCEKDIHYIRRCYPEKARRMLTALCDACDKMEYEGSSMLAEYPDKETIHRLVEQIYENSQKTGKTQVERNQIGSVGARELTGVEAAQAAEKELLQVMLCDEIHRRRMRYRRRSQLFSNC